MPADEGDDKGVSLQEVVRVLNDFRHEMRGQLNALVRNDVYRAEQSAMGDRVKRLEQDLDRSESERQQNRRMVNGAILASLGTFLAALIMFIIAVTTRHG